MVTASGLLDAMEGVAYVTDLDGIILDVGCEHFDRFARSEAGNNGLTGREVLGTSLFSYVSEGAVRDMVMRIHRRATSSMEGSLTFETRCDSVKVKRMILNSVRPIVEDGEVKAVLYQSITASEKMRPPVMLVSTGDGVKVMQERDAVRYLHMCSYCARVGLPFNAPEEDMTWVSGPEYYKIYGDYPVSITHGICSDCFGALDAALKRPGSGDTVSLNQET